MQQLPSQPSINKGTLILLAPNATDSAISSKNIFFVFQYNPEKLLHSFNQAIPSTLGANTADSQGLLAEFFNLTFELDGADNDPSSQHQSSADFGLHPTLAMLELMMQPQVVGRQKSMPIVVFKWGAKRSVAVQFVGMSIEEKSFDVTLNPTRATVSLTLRVLDATEVNNSPGARTVCLNHQKMRATLVDAYELQTGQTRQATPSGAKDNSSLSGSVGAASGGESKQKIKA
jgi:hypothetical protein